MKPSNSFLTSYLIQTKTICLDVIVCIYACWITYCIAYHILSPLSIIDFWNSIRHTLLDVEIPPPPAIRMFLLSGGVPLPAIRYSFLDLNGEIPSPYYDIKNCCKKPCKNAITIDVTFKNASWNCNFERCCSFRCVVVAIYWFWPPSASIQGDTLLNGGTPPTIRAILCAL